MRTLNLIVLLFTAIISFASPSGTPTLLIFSGSDWCIPCINFEKNILSTDEFKNYSDLHLLVVKADFPQHKKLSKEQVAKNEKLAERYNPNGAFPHVVLLSENGTVLKQINTRIDDPKLLIKQIEEALPSTTMKEYRKKCLLMGSSFEFTIVHNNAKEADSLLNTCIKEVERIESLISEWDSTTEVSQINKNAGLKAVQVSSEVYNLFDRCITLSHITGGAFDISFRGINLYDFDKTSHEEFPDSNEVSKSLDKVGYKNIQLLKDHEILLNKKGMAVGFGASGKGYAADRVRDIMVKAGITSGVINASGDLTCWGTRADGSAWRVGISDPEKSTEMKYWLPVDNGAVATSGSYEKYFDFQGVRYSHIINPKTGFPVSDKKSVSVFSNSAELSDALATALFVLPIDQGLDLLVQFPNVKALIIDTQNQVYHSKNLQLVE